MQNEGVPRILRSAKRCAAYPGSMHPRGGPGSSEQREERCTASGTRCWLCSLAVFGEVGELEPDFGGAGQALLRRLPFLEEDYLHVRPDLGRLAVLANEVDEAIGLRELVVAERDHDALRPGIDLLDIGAAAIALDRGDLEQIAHLVRQHAEAVAQFGGKIVDLLVAIEIGQRPVQR